MHFQGTIVAKEDFDAEEDAVALKGAMRGLGKV